MLVRREFVIGGAVSLVRDKGIAERPPSISIIDSHIHLWDETRPQGAPCCKKESVLGRRRVLPREFRTELAARGVVGAIAIEASHWIEDNLWLLEQCATDDFMVGAVGNLRPEDRDFGQYLERYHKNRLFLGIRPRAPGYNIGEQLTNPRFFAGLRLLAQLGLVLELGIDEVVRISDAVPQLKLVVELPGINSPPRNTGEKTTLREVHARPQIYAQMISYTRAGQYRLLNADREAIDLICEAFGDDRIFAGFFIRSRAELQIWQEYYAAKSKEAAEKFFWKNSLAAYRWIHRRADQPHLRAPA